MAWEDDHEHEAGHRKAPSEETTPKSGGVPSFGPSGVATGSSPGSGPLTSRAPMQSARASHGSVSSESPKKPEATLVLAERRLDVLRAEVKRRQRRFVLQRSGALVGWMLAGALAMTAGVFAARAIRGSNGESKSGLPVSEGVTAEPVSEPSVPGTGTSVAPSSGAPSEDPAAAKEVAPASAATPSVDAISLDSLPTRSAVEGKKARSARSR